MLAVTCTSLRSRTATFTHLISTYCPARALFSFPTNGWLHNLDFLEGALKYLRERVWNSVQRRRGADYFASLCGVSRHRQQVLQSRSQNVLHLTLSFDTTVDLRCYPRERALCELTSVEPGADETSQHLSTRCRSLSFVGEEISTRNEECCHAVRNALLKLPPLKDTQRL